MNNKPNFIISLDCEGKWGTIGLKEIQKNINSENLNYIYKKINNLLIKYEMPATFAFVMAFILSEEEAKKFECLSTEKKNQNNFYLKEFWKSKKQGNTEGWLEPKIFDEIIKNNNIEIASHGFTHFLCDDRANNLEVENEFRNSLKVSRIKNLSLKTFIFPENKIGNLHILKKFNFIGYRNAYKLKYKGNSIDRFKNFLDEFNIFQKLKEENNKNISELVAIPSGFFFNSKFGLRSLVPGFITFERWKSLINDTIKKNKTLHLWFHPHNLISAPNSFFTLENIIKYVNDLRKLGKISVITQEQYVKEKVLFNFKDK